MVCGPSLALKLILAARLIAAFYSNISDCDETFNYWEPVRNRLGRCVSGS
jgi:alpha-1,2-mannosyltransferase